MRALFAAILALFFCLSAAAQHLTLKTPYAGPDPAPDTACLVLNAASKPTSCPATAIACTITAKNPLCPLAGITADAQLYLVWCRSTGAAVNDQSGTGATYYPPGCASSDPFAYRLGQLAGGAGLVVVP